MLRALRLLFLLPPLLALIPLGKAIAAPLTPENSNWNINRNASARTPVEYTGEWPGHNYFPSPDDWRRIGIYHLVTDRFFDGDPTNNDGRYGGFDVKSRSMRQGGDFKGLTQKLDYIKELGFSAIWISPVFQNRYNSYHGYGQVDFTLLDDRFGTLQEFRTLVNEAHARGIYVIADIVVNHLASLYHEEGFQGRQAPFRFHDGEYRMVPNNPSEVYADFQVDNSFITTGKYCPVYNWDGSVIEDAAGGGSFWNSDLHHNGALTDFADPWNIHLGKIYGSYDDLRLCSSRVQEKLIAMTTALIASTDIDGIRMDTPMQVPLSFFKVWAPAVRDFAARKGKLNFPIFGETYATRMRTATMIGRGRSVAAKSDATIDEVVVFDGGVDYSFYQSSIEPIFRGELEGSARFLFDNLEIERSMYDFHNLRSGQSEFRMLNFIGSHDQRRLRMLKDGDRKLNLAAQLLAIWPGIPVWYYGDEQGLCSAGMALDGDARESMMHSIAWQDFPSCESTNPALRDNFDLTNKSYLAVAKAMELRMLYPQYFASDEVKLIDYVVSSDPGAILFSRGSGNNQALVAMNFSRSAKRIRWPLSFPMADYVQVRGVVQAESHGKYVELEPFESKVYLPKIAVITERPRIVAISPEHDSLVDSSSVPVSIRFSNPMNSESVATAIRCAEQSPLALKSSADHTTFTFRCNLKCGVTQISVSKDAKSVSGNNLFADWSSRVRASSAQNINAEEKQNEGLLPEAFTQTPPGSITLAHHACGASFMRVSTNGGRSWAPWTSYKPTSTIELRDGNGWQSLMAQYWIAGSAAYLVEDGVDLFNPPWRIEPPSLEHEPMHNKGVSKREIR